MTSSPPFSSLPFAALFQLCVRRSTVASLTAVTRSGSSRGNRPHRGRESERSPLAKPGSAAEAGDRSLHAHGLNGPIMQRKSKTGEGKPRGGNGEIVKCVPRGEFAAMSEAG